MTHTDPIHEIKAQRAERPKRKKNPWEAFSEVRAYQTGEVLAAAERDTPAGQVLAAAIGCLLTGRDLTLLAQEWLDRSHQQELLCALVSRAAQPGQQLRCTMLAAHSDAEAVLAPSLLIAG